MTPDDKTEREHCFQVAALALANAGVATVGGVTQLVAHEFMRERAAARAERDATNSRYVQEVNNTNNVLRQRGDKLRAELAELQSKHEALTAAARAAQRILACEGDHCPELDAALSPSPSTPREGAEPDSDDDADVGAPSCMRCYDAPWGCKVCDPECRLVRKPEQGGGGCEHCGQPKHDHAPGCRLFPL